MTGCERRHNVRYIIIPAQTSAFDVSTHTHTWREDESERESEQWAEWCGMEWNEAAAAAIHAETHTHTFPLQQSGVDVGGGNGTGTGGGGGVGRGEKETTERYSCKSSKTCIVRTEKSREKRETEIEMERTRKKNFLTNTKYTPNWAHVRSVAFNVLFTDWMVARVSCRKSKAAAAAHPSKGNGGSRAGVRWSELGIQRAFRNANRARERESEKRTVATEARLRLHTEHTVKNSSSILKSFGHYANDVFTSQFFFPLAFWWMWVCVSDFFFALTSPFHFFPFRPADAFVFAIHSIFGFFPSAHWMQQRMPFQALVQREEERQKI